VVCSGFHDTVGLYRNCSAEENRIAQNCMEVLGIAGLRDENFGFLSNGQRQMILIARAMVKSPVLLMIDEPCNGLDISKRTKLLEIIDYIGRHTKTSLIYATHNPEEIPPCTTHILRLDRGRVVGIEYRSPI
jgi:molybdate transport system ATP-binding protein